MSGNVWEWCWDDIDGANRRVRGGSWSFNACFAEVSLRDYLYYPDYRNFDYGFRVVLGSVP
jgi:formylglycine-generating enzyme required for sulfatase activity